MKFTIEQKALAQAAAMAAGVVEKRNTIPILANVKLATDDSGVIFTATDLDAEISVTKDAEVIAHGAVTVPADMLKSISAKLDSGKPVIVEEKDGYVTLKSGRSNFKLNTLPAEDFPELSTGAFESEQSVSGDVLGRALDRTVRAASKEEHRYYLNGVAMQFRDGVIKTIATDGHRLIVEQIAGDELPDVIIPTKAVNEIKAICAANGTVELSVSATKIRCIGTDTVYTSKVIDGTFPDWTRVVPAWSDSVLTVGATTMSEAAARVALVATERTRAVRLSVDADGVTLTVRGSDGGNAEDYVEGKWAGSGGVEIGVNAAYLADALQLAEKGDLDISITAPMDPIRVQFHESPDTIAVLMPMRC